MADNVNVKDAADATVIAAAKEIAAGVYAPKVFVVDATGDDLLGDLTASPAANTIGARLKTIADSLTTIDGRVDGLEGFLDGVETLITSTNSALTTIDGRVDGLETLITATNAALATMPAAEYETVAASATDQVLGGTGATGDLLVSLLIVPATTSPGAVSIKDGAGSAITVFTGGASSVGSLVPFPVPLGLKSTAGAWKVTTGANVSVIASGDFSA